MKLRVNAALLGIGLGILGMTVTPALADGNNKEIQFTFSAPVEVPGHVLLPGTYVFQRADEVADPNVILIFKLDAKGARKFVTTEFAIPEYRADLTGKPVINFTEARIGNPEEVHSWFYPGEYTGWEFSYAAPPRVEAAAPNAATAAGQ